MEPQDFQQKWSEGLTAYLKKQDKSRTSGFTRRHRDGTPARHGYIIDLKNGEDELDIITKYNVLYGKEDFVNLVGKVHPLARHLNSSQVMCYNFFRPLMSVDTLNLSSGLANERLVAFVQEKLGISIRKGALCKFEYEDIATQERFKSYAKNGLGEKSQFDFYIKDGVTEIYFEIKFTESSFGKWPSSNTLSKQSILNHCSYVEKGYKPMLERSRFFTRECKDTILSFPESMFSELDNPFNTQYQLFRNALKAEDTKYSVFVFPNANPDTEREFSYFRTNLISGQNHIVALRWEDLTAFMSKDFIEKYIDIF